MHSVLERFWRQFATALCFGLFGAGGIVFTLFAAPIILLCTRSPCQRARRTRYLVSYCFAGFIETARLLGVLEYRVKHRDRLRQPGCVIVANHPSLIDVVFLIALAPEADCVVKRALWRNPFTAVPIRLASYTSNDSATKLISRCKASLDAGNRLIMFAEGTRSRPGAPLRFQRGAAHVALAAHADMVPVTIVLPEPALTKGQRWLQVPDNKLSLTFSVERPIKPPDRAVSDYNNARAARHLTSELQQFFAERLNVAGNE